MAGARGFWAGVAETLGIVTAFTGAGLAGSALLGLEPCPAGLPEAPYTLEAMDGPRLWLVDGFNALHVALLRGRERQAWWTEERRAELLARVRGFEDPTAEVWIVFDGPRPLPVPPTGQDPAGAPRIAFAPSADEWLLRRVKDAAPGEVAVVTADRRLADRARARGARVISPQAFLARCRRPGASRTGSQAPGVES
jgi:hypothetical protein